MMDTGRKAGARMPFSDAASAHERPSLIHCREQGAAPRTYRKLLIATDFSSHSLIAAQAALAMAPEAEIVIAHAYRIADQGLMLDLGVPAHIMRSCLEKAREVANQQLDDFSQALGHERMPKRVALYGRPRCVIPDYAASIGADLVALGCARRSFLGDVFAPSLGTRLTRMKLDVVHGTPLPGPRWFAARLRMAMLQGRLS